MEIEQSNSAPSTTDTVHISGSEIATVQPAINQDPNFTILLPKASSPIQTNKASSSLPAGPSPPVTEPPYPSLENQSTSKPTPASSGQAPIPAQKRTLVERLRASADFSLRRLAPVSLAPSGRPRIIIPDAVFQKGAEIHKDFIICYFNGKSPPFKQIQSVFNYMWGKGNGLEIHNNPLNRSVIVRIQSEYLRKKILDKSIWYVGESMFHTAQWNSEHSTSTPPLKAIKIWAHLTGIPLDLRHDEGLSLVAGLVGEPKETDEFTRNLVSLTVSHVKVEVDLTVPLPTVVEFERQSGEVVEVHVHYPWVPPTCAHCHELGHIQRNCLTFTPPVPETEKQTASTQTGSSKTPKIPPKTPQKTPLKPNPNSLAGFTPSKASKKSQKIYRPILQPPASLSTPKPIDPPPSPRPNYFSTPDPVPRPSLKRSRSSPTLSPPAVTSTDAPPFSTTIPSLKTNLPSTSTVNPFSVLQLNAPPSKPPDPPLDPFCDLSSKPSDPTSQLFPSSSDQRGAPSHEDPQTLPQ
ncbi:Uncharacterized protein Rs2_49635 [Raphanus sativus]|nr:Uncharacterized protein Rs2_49635 [Raphanus sativus]